MALSNSTLLKGPRSLENDEVNTLHARVVDLLQAQLEVKIR